MFDTDTSNIWTAELTDSELDIATGGAIQPPNNSTKMPHGPIGPGPTTGPFWPQPKTM
jgi:hypothetical protein